jgi:hypothetical protein
MESANHDDVESRPKTAKVNIRQVLSELQSPLGTWDDSYFDDRNDVVAVFDSKGAFAHKKAELYLFGFFVTVCTGMFFIVLFFVRENFRPYFLTPSVGAILAVARIALPDLITMRKYLDGNQHFALTMTEFVFEQEKPFLAETVCLLKKDTSICPLSES